MMNQLCLALRARLCFCCTASETRFLIDYKKKKKNKMWKKCKNNNNLRATRSAGAGETHEMCVNMFCGERWADDKRTIFRSSLFGRKEGLDGSSRTPSWWSDCGSAECPLISPTCRTFFYSSHSATQCRSQRHNLPRAEGLHAHTRFKLANEMQQHVAPNLLPSPHLSYKACRETMVTPSRGLLFAVHW